MVSSLESCTEHKSCSNHNQLSGGEGDRYMQQQCRTEMARLSVFMDVGVITKTVTAYLAGLSKL